MNKLPGRLPVLAASLLSLAVFASPAAAHHAIGGRMPTNFVEGFFSGLAHPVIGFDHLAFTIAVGLLAVLNPNKGLTIPITFVLATIGGTGLHLLSLDLPFPETVIAASVLTAGLLLAANRSPSLWGTLLLAGLAGIFHGYAYGEAIVGAEMTPLVAYLAGFAAIQLAIACGVAFGARALQNAGTLTDLSLRFAGFILCGIGATFLIG